MIFCHNYTLLFLQNDLELLYHVKPGDLLFAWSGTKDSSFGARIWHGTNAILNQHIFKVVPYKEKLTIDYALLVLLKVQEDIVKKAHGFKASFVHIKKSDLEITELPLPPLPEQKAIARVLSDVDELIRECDSLLTKKRDIKQGTMQQLLTGKQRLPGFSGEWEEKKLGDICWFQEGPGLRQWQFTKEGMKVINVTNLENGYLNLDRTDRHISIEEFTKMYQHFEIDSGDIVVASSGNSYGKTSVVRTQDLPLMMNTSVIRFKPLKKLAYKFLLSFLRSNIFKNQIDLLITGGAQPNFGPVHLDKIVILIPPTLPEQKAIAEILSDMDAEIESLEKKRDKYKAIKQGMMQELLTGRIRLID